MNRLRHSYAAQLRILQLSSNNLFVFVEGKQSDPYVYARICASIPNFHARYEICLAEQLLGASGGGKQALLSFFSFLRQNNALVSSLGGKKTTCIFFLDKDLDDLQSKKKRSPHVVYTEHYDIQNYIFLHGNLLNGAASAASVDPTILCAELSDASKWCLRIAELWREWISLCLHVLEENISCEANYGVASRVQIRPCGPTDTNRYDHLTCNLATRCGLPVTVFRQRLATTTSKVDIYFAKGQHHRIFKGKWFSTVLADDIDRIMAGRPYDRNRLASRLASSVAATLDFTEDWAVYFKNRIRKVSAVLL